MEHIDKTIIINIDSREVTVDDVPCRLLSLDFDLLEYFINNTNKVFSREELVNSGVWINNLRTHRVVDQAVYRLRKSLGSDVISTIPGRGYCWVVKNSFIETSDKTYHRKDVELLIDKLTSDINENIETEHSIDINVDDIIDVEDWKKRNI